MNDMKCPFCQQELEKHYWDDLECYACPDLTCDGYYMSATKDMWQELIRTRKALDVAKKWLMKIGYLNMSDHGLGSEEMMTDWCKSVALQALKEIETLQEQKD